MSTTPPTSIQVSAAEILRVLTKAREQAKGRGELDGPTISEITGLEPHDVNDAVALLRDSGYVEWIQFLETVDYDFAQVWVTPAGRMEGERLSNIFAEPLRLDPTTGQRAPPHKSPVALPPAPIGSPYGFSDEDWEHIAQMRSRTSELRVVLGYQFKSQHYDADALRENVKHMLVGAVSAYNDSRGSLKTHLVYAPLAAGYGEHLFNEIARDIIAADIAVFETSDLNPNVMLELGVALTWGTRVLPIKHHSRPKPPSDISGQTWADYDDSALRFMDPEHAEKMLRMVQRAVLKKGRAR
ncbi:MAG TPA: hypothetical protein VI032_12845 [Burkholderiaceae bacterium]